MLGYAARRLVETIPTLILVGLAVFVLMRLIPGDPVQVMLGEGADPATIARFRAELGLDGPLPLQLLAWFAALAQGDFGVSIVSGEPVLPLLLARFQISATIVMVAVALATLVAVPVGLLAAWRQDGIADLAIVATATLLLSIPSFWLGLVLLLIFGLKLGWLPVVGTVPAGEGAWASVGPLVLPVITLVLVEVGVLARMMRASAIDVLRLDYVTNARAKGLSELRILARHVLPNAFAPTWTLVGLILGNLLGGIAVLETVFTIPGFGRLLVDGIYARDYPVVQGCLLVTATVYVVVNLVVDLCYPLFDPRVATR